MEGASGATSYLRVMGGVALKRIVVLFVVSTLLVLALAVPAFAANPCEHPGPQNAQEISCEKASAGVSFGQSHRP